MNYEEAGLLHEQFVLQALKTPLRIAVVDVNYDPISYEKLNEITDRLASIMQNRGVNPESVIVIHMDKCIQYVIAYIAILKAGGAYLPLDVSYPQSLIADIMMEVEPKIVITKATLASQTVEYIKGGEENIITLEDITFFEDIERLSCGLSLVEPCLTLESTAFVVYSSGTTGRPKGISVPLRAPILSYKWRHDVYPYDDNEREAANVFFVWELFRPLLKGQTLYIIPDDTIYDPPKLLQFLKNYTITRMLFTPSLLETVIDFPVQSVTEGFQTMKQVWLCGEVTTTALIERAMAILPHVQFINLYSVSECHDVAAINLTSFYRDKPEKLSESKFAPVGQLLPSVKVIILEKDGSVPPVGVPGEIYVYGPTLANGYVKRPDITREKFLPLSETISGEHAINERMYKTGDWGYLLSDRSMEICGRCDAMVKIRGYSVELSAVEAVLMGLSCVQSCVVVTVGDEGQDKALVAYVVPSKMTTARRIRGELKRRLPFYMIPSYFVFIKEIPILPGSGKLNKKALPPPLKDDPSNKPEFSPKTETEKILAEIWSKVLQISSIDIQESFFDLGGHSLLAAKLLQIVNNRFLTRLSVKELYTSPTVTWMAKIIDGKAPKNVPIPDLAQEVSMHCQYDNDLDIQLRAFWRFSSFNKTRWSKASVLLTGATGYLGAFLLAELLCSTESHIFCLIRDTIANGNTGNVVEIERRLCATMEQYELIGDLESHLRVKERVTFVKGDVSLINFGLSEDDYRYLSTEIDYVIHAAAYVNLTYPYSALYSSNVLGTCNVIKFASHSKIKPLHYISTDAVFPDNFQGQEDSDLSAMWPRLKNGYSQSKWVAEQIVIKSSERGHPVVIYRLGNQAPDSVHGALNNDDFNFMIIRSMVLLGCHPDVDWSMEMTPVDFTAKVVVECTKTVVTHVGKVLHLISERPLKSSVLETRIRLQGYKSEAVPYDQYLDRLKHSDVEVLSKLYSVLSEVAPTAEYLDKVSLHGSQMTRKILEPLQLHYPDVTNSLLTLYFANFIERGIIPAPNINENSFKMLEDSNNVSIRGKVAVITGASSGIGEETAVLLARAGCHVALLARRLDKLKDIAEIIKSFRGKAITVKTDVANESEVDAAINSVQKQLGPIDILINCAGAMFYQHVYSPQISDCMAMIDVNVKGLFLCTSKVLPSMVERKSGHIVNISSDAGRTGFPGLAVYSGTKFFVEGYSQSLRKEVSQFNIRVSCIQPGDVATPLQQLSIANKNAAKEFFPEHKEPILEAKDIARTIAFVLSCPKYMAVNEVLVEPTSAPC